MGIHTTGTKGYVLWAELWAPPQIHIYSPKHAVLQNVTIFEGMALKEAIELKQDD